MLLFTSFSILILVISFAEGTHKRSGKGIIGYSGDVAEAVEVGEVLPEDGEPTCVCAPAGGTRRSRLRRLLSRRHSRRSLKLNTRTMKLAQRKLMRCLKDEGLSDDMEREVLQEASRRAEENVLFPADEVDDDPTFGQEYDDEREDTALADLPLLRDLEDEEESDELDDDVGDVLNYNMNTILARRRNHRRHS